MSSSKNIGVALCLSAEGYLLYSKPRFFLKPKEDENKLFM
jgi:hypothetical protein